ncbi:hypothetical protein [Streptomyces aureus]|uniref:Uncharacterized protein n=1 Tax=Streptomyces aureus TaxID=193461 RepID=A0ABV4SYV4_9ACTN
MGDNHRSQQAAGLIRSVATLTTVQRGLGHVPLRASALYGHAALIVPVEDIVGAVDPGGTKQSSEGEGTP